MRGVLWRPESTRIVFDKGLRPRPRCGAYDASHAVGWGRGNYVPPPQQSFGIFFVEMLHFGAFLCATIVNKHREYSYDSVLSVHKRQTTIKPRKLLNNVGMCQLPRKFWNFVGRNATFWCIFSNHYLWPLTHLGAWLRVPLPPPKKKMRPWDKRK